MSFTPSRIGIITRRSTKSKLDLSGTNCDGISVASGGTAPGIAGDDETGAAGGAGAIAAMSCGFAMFAREAGGKPDGAGDEVDVGTAA